MADSKFDLDLLPKYFLQKLNQMCSNITQQFSRMRHYVIHYVTQCDILTKIWSEYFLAYQLVVRTKCCRTVNKCNVCTVVNNVKNAT